MTRLRRVLQTKNSDERSHAAPLVLTLVSAAGAIALAVGVAAESDVAAIIGGIALAVGLLATTVVSHMNIDYSIFSRLDNLEK